MTIKRRQAREWAVQMLVAADLNPVAGVDRLIDDFWAQRATLDEEDGGLEGDVGKKMREFANVRVRGVMEKREAIDAEISSLLENWDLFRLGTVERAVLRMGVWELENCPDVPPKVVINEAIDLVNWFASPKSRALVNGVLDKVAKGLQNADGQ